MRLKLFIVIIIAVALSSCRRDLYVYGDEFHSVTLDVDWREYSDSDPDGMSCWFFPHDEKRQPSYVKTANVRHADLYLGHGDYTGVIIDYSPEEYSRQEFLGMDRASTARVVLTPASYQPDDSVNLSQLYGKECFHETLPIVRETGYYEVSNTAEMMALDTLENMHIKSGEYGDYIPYEVRDTYQSTLAVQKFSSVPATPIWRMRIRIFVKGLDYLWSTEASLAGLATGRYLALNKPTDEPCLISLTDWEIQRTGNNEGYISITFNNFGLRGSQHPYRSYDNEGHDITPNADGSSRDYGNSRATTRSMPGNVVDWYSTRSVRPEDLRLNLMFTLRDRATVLYYHYDVGEYVVSFDNQLVLRLELGPDFPNGPDLPYVDAYESAGFDAEVTPWEDGGNADVPM